MIHPGKERISAGVFHRPRQDATIGPLAELIAKDVDGKARYRSMSCLDFMKNAFSPYLLGKNLNYYNVLCCGLRLLI